MKKALIEKTPNFTILLAGCSSSCNWCTDPMNRKQSNDYMSNLIDLVLSDKIPSVFQQVSISGGNPTENKHFTSVLSLLRNSKRFKKVVLTTNGYKILDYLKDISETVHYVNISRHDVGYEANQKVFNTSKIATDDEIKRTTEYLSKHNTNVTFNHVYTNDDVDKMTLGYVSQFVDYAKDLGITDICFRYDQANNTLDETWFEKLFVDYKRHSISGCPVCRSFSITYKGMNLKFKASYVEPSKHTGEVYELIYHINGKLVTDWSGTDLFDLKSFYNTYEVDVEKELLSHLNDEINADFHKNVVDEIVAQASPIETYIETYKEKVSKYHKESYANNLYMKKRDLYDILRSLDLYVEQIFDEKIKNSFLYQWLLTERDFLAKEMSELVNRIETKTYESEKYNSCGRSDVIGSCGSYTWELPSSCGGSSCGS